ncbi:HGL014Cp [Eremothecium sinecaudum]|uniref:HGL014Cp n=1 Tax=Eremothecium sinecaudum TaxID=45286 RepID=A0A0X8HVL5_9SACH|nr:HGL014Cp [Eremothecium sinecaudum]AMD22326.1 HGL014Cp [Eremothecium sinecaudum]
MESDKVEKVLDLDEKFSKIRSHMRSKLDNQKHIAIILSAVEENMDEQHAPSKNVVNYFISFMSLVDQSIDENTKEIKDLQLASSSIYLLDLLFPHIPKKLLRSKFGELLTKIAPCITDSAATPALIRSSIGCLESLLIAQDSQCWNNEKELSVNPITGLSGLLELSLDSRSKIRKRAQEAIANILKNPPPSPTAEHIASPLVGNFVVKSLAGIIDEISNLSNKKMKAMNGADELHAKSIHILQLISTIVSVKQWPSLLTEQLCDLLLEVSKSSNEFLVSKAFGCFEVLFQVMAESSVSSGLAEDKFLTVLDIIFSLKPSKADINIAVAWIAVVAKGITTYASYQPLKCMIKLPEIFDILSFYLSSETQEVYFSASQCMITIIRNAIRDELLLYPPSVTEEIYENVDDIISTLAEKFTSYLSIGYTHCAKESLQILVAAFKKLRYRCNPDFIKPLEIVGEWRTDEERYLDFKAESEHVIGAAIQAIGPGAVLGCLPLNLDSQCNSKPGRAWLLPLIRDHTKHSELSIFVKQLMPLIEHFESRCINLDKESVTLKLYQTIIDQLWSTLPRFCELPTDLRVSFTDEFASSLSSTMYSKVELRTVICNSLKVLAESNSLHLNGTQGDDLLLNQQVPPSETKLNIEYLSSKAPKILAVLFNIYTNTAPNARGYIIEAIEAYLNITPADELTKTFNNVCSLLKNAMDEESSAKKSRGKVNLSATLLDIVVAMTAFVPASSYPALLSIFSTTVNSSDVLTQKRAYRIIATLTKLENASNAVNSYVSDIENVILDAAKSVQTASKASRLIAIKTLIEILPSDHLQFIVKVAPEVILCCKDVNEKSREAAFGSLIAMGKKMADPNGVIKLSTISGYDPKTPDQPSSISELFKIISAGLIGESQHMVSATIGAYSCLFFEFKDAVEPSMLMEIYDTIELYMTSNSREIVKSAIGFCKVCCLSLPDEFMRPKVPALLPKLLRWSHEHTGHFKARVKHIIERLIRRFGYDFVEANFPIEDRKLLTNIRKTRNRNKRKAAEDSENANATAVSSTKSSRFSSAFDEAIYESSEDESSDDENAQTKKKHSKQYIVESKDTPLDLLDSQALAHISSTIPKKFKKQQKGRSIEDSTFSFDAEGKLVVKDSEQGLEDDPLSSITSGLNSYLEAVKNGPIKGQKGRLKYKKGKRSGNDSDDDVAEDFDLPNRSATTNSKIGKKKGMFKNKRKL